MKNTEIPEEKLQEIADLLSEARCYLAPATKDWVRADLAMFTAQKILWLYVPAEPPCEQNGGKPVTKPVKSD